jgi:hypothetical protein
MGHPEQGRRVIGFTPQPGGGYTVAFERHEATLLSDLAWQIAELLSPLASAPAPAPASGQSSPGVPDADRLFAERDPLATLDAQGSLALHGDPAIARLLPDAYGDDADADSASDFRRYTEQGLVDRKVANALVVINTLAPNIDDGMSDGMSGQATAEFEAGSVESGAEDGPTRVQLTETQAQSWLRGLTDIRLTLASRIGIETEEDAAEEDYGDTDYDTASDSDLDTGTDLGTDTDTGSGPDNTARFLRDIYHWLGFVSESLLAAIDREPDARPH